LDIISFEAICASGATSLGIDVINQRKGLTGSKKLNKEINWTIEIDYQST